MRINWHQRRILFCTICLLLAMQASCFGQTATKPSSANDRLQTISQSISNEIPLVIAHRGASGYLPEHTTEAAAFAHALGADYIEQDVVLSKDGIAVVLHDVTLNAVTNVSEVFPERAVDGKYYVCDFLYSELQKLRVKERDDRGRFPANTGDFRIATLEAHVQLIGGLNQSRKRNAGLYVEIKQPALHLKRNLDPSREVLRVLSKYGYRESNDRVFLQCFDEAETVRIRTELKCELPLIQLYSNAPTPEQIQQIAKVVDGIGIRISAVVSSTGSDREPVFTNVVATAHQNALMVHVWTLRDDQLPKYADTSEVLIDWLVKGARVDGIFTDHPDTLLAWRKKVSANGPIRGPFHLLKNGASQR